MRGGAVAARWAHNPKVAGSNPVPATFCYRRQCRDQIALSALLLLMLAVDYLCRRVCEEGSCPHFAECPEYEVSLKKPGIHPDWKQIGLGMYELEKPRAKNLPCILGLF